MEPTQLAEDEAPLGSKDGLRTSLTVSSLESQGQQARPRTRKAVSVSLENLRKKRNGAGKAVTARIKRIDELLLE